MMRTGHPSQVSGHEIRLAISFAIGIAPALALMWLSLRRFDYPIAPKALFDDRRLFLAFAVGMVFGVFASLLNIYLSLTATSAGFGPILALIAIALFEESFKLVYLNRSGYRGRFDTTFYGVSLALGSASTLVSASGFGLNPSLTGAPETIALLIAFSVSMALILASTGSLIGFGAAQQQSIRYFVRAYLVRLAHLLILFFFFTGADIILSAGSLAAALVFAAIVYGFVYTEILPETLPRDVRRSLRRWPQKSQRPIKESE